MKLTLAPSTALMALILAPSMAAARPPEGAYIGFGLGYASASGDRGVPLEDSVVLGTDAQYEELVRTDGASGFAFDLHFGYLIGPLAPEIGIVGHGSFDFENGGGYPNFLLRFHPLLVADSLAELKFDTNVFIGAGYAISGYQPDEKVTGPTEGKGWEGWALHFGLGLTYDLAERVRLGVDLRCVLPQYSTFMIDWDDDINAEPTETPSTFVFVPTLQIIATF